MRLDQQFHKTRQHLFAMKDLRVIAKIVQFVSSDYCGIISTFCMISAISTRILFDFAFEKKTGQLLL